MNLDLLTFEQLEALCAEKQEQAYILECSYDGRLPPEYRELKLEISEIYRRKAEVKNGTQ